MRSFLRFAFLLALGGVVLARAFPAIGSRCREMFEARATEANEAYA